MSCLTQFRLVALLACRNQTSFYMLTETCGFLNPAKNNRIQGSGKSFEVAGDLRILDTRNHRTETMALISGLVRSPVQVNLLIKLHGKPCTPICSQDLQQDDQTVCGMVFFALGDRHAGVSFNQCDFVEAFANSESATTNYDFLNTTQLASRAQAPIHRTVDLHLLVHRLRCRLPG